MASGYVLDGPVYTLGANGQLYLKTVDSKSSQHAKRHLSDGAKVALTLTDLCCSRGSGKVLQITRHEFKQETIERFYAWEAFEAVPELIYFPYEWTEEERDEWANLGLQDKVHMITARHGSVPEIAAVLPFDVNHQNSEAEGAKRHLFSALKCSTITVLFTPFPHIGPTKTMRERCRLYLERDRSDHIVKCTYIPETKGHGWSQLRQWKVDNLFTLLDYLEEIWEGKRFGDVHIRTYATVLGRLIAAGQCAASAGQHNGTRGLKTVFNSLTVSSTGM